MSNKTLSRENKLLYTIFAMLKCVTAYKDFIFNSPNFGIQREIKQDLNALSSYIRRLFYTVESAVSKEDYIIWRKDWDRDYMSAASIFECWAVLDDEKRDLLAAFADRLVKPNNITGTLPFITLHGAIFTPGNRYLVIRKGEDNTMIEATFHNNKLGFYSNLITQYIPLDNISSIYAI